MSKELGDALRQLQLRAVSQEDSVTNSSEEKWEEQEWLIQFNFVARRRIENAFDPFSKEHQNWPRTSRIAVGEKVK